nr:adenylate/guanylate cyclase domain-containing protein [Pseudenhygromyxa sp. WMMC2535]
MISIRVFEAGFATYSRGIYEFEALDPTHTRLYVYFGWIPTGPITRVIFELAAGWLQRSYVQLVDELRAKLSEHALPLTTASSSSSSSSSLSPASSASTASTLLDARALAQHLRSPPSPLGDEAKDRLESLATALRARSLSAEAVDALVAHVREADDDTLQRIQILPLARRMGLEPRALLSTCLHATRLGMLELGWEVICPHCRGPRTRATTLGDVPPEDSCPVCEVEFSTHSERALEIVFTVHPSIREVATVLHCSAEPAKKAHIEVQQVLAPGERRLVSTDLQPDSYRVRLRGREQAVDTLLDVERGQEAPARWTWRASERLPERLRLAPEPTLELVNDGEDPQTLVIERRAWTDDALRPAQLFSFQEFRDLFSDEYIDAEIQLAVGEQTIVFTDIVGSTEFYAARGDPEAFVEVKRHFTEIYEEVRDKGGAVVKTIGDAAMAAFNNPIDALRASAAILRRFHAEREDTSIRLRVSLNTGPCIAVNLNSGIDYFGTAVNLASKLQSLAAGGEIAMSEQVYEAPGVREYLEAEGAALVESTLEHPAFAAPLPARRWVVDPRVIAG